MLLPDHQLYPKLKKNGNFFDENFYDGKNNNNNKKNTESTQVAIFIKGSVSFHLITLTVISLGKESGFWINLPYHTYLYGRANRSGAGVAFRF